MYTVHGNWYQTCVFICLLSIVTRAVDIFLVVLSRASEMETQNNLLYGDSDTSDSDTDTE